MSSIRNIRKWDLRFLSLAKEISTWSKDPSTKVGALIARPNMTISSLGFNGLPRKVLDYSERLMDRNLKYEMVVHGEINAIIHAKEDLTGFTLFTYPFQPCSRCASLIVQAGITRVVSIHPIDNETVARWSQNFSIAKTIFREALVSLDLYSHRELSDGK